MIYTSLRGKKIFVTGGSRGIGAAIVKLLAEQGACVAFTYSSRKESAETVLNSLPHPQNIDGSLNKDLNHMILQMDLSQESSIEAALAELSQKWPQIDGVVNNAGITKDQLLLRMKTEDFDQVINTNLRGNFIIIKNFAKTMMKARKGSIVNITSVIGQTGNAGQSNYAASKAGLIAFSKSIAQEIGSRGVRLNCVAPGFITTEMTSILNDETKQKILTKIPLETLGEPIDVAHAVAFLLCDESKYMTGHTLNVNGGMYMN